MRIDLNCDLGEGCGNDVELMALITSANIACGYHAGDAETMKRTVDLAMANGVAVGAHPGYPDRENFGRSRMNLSSVEVFDLIVEQISALRDICDVAGCSLAHVKPHGALYNAAAREPELAYTIAKAVRSFNPDLTLVGLSGSYSITEAQKLGLKTASEVFADRTYQPDGSLTPRTEPNALIDNIREAVDQVLTMVENGTVRAANGELVSIMADSVCLHGDGEHAIEFARAIRDELAKAGVEVKALNA